MKVQILISILIFFLLSAACVPIQGAHPANANVDPTTDACLVSLASCETLTPASGDLAQARSALTAFFDALNGGQYEKASEIYGGSYEELIDMNPDIDSTNRAALLERACTVNGFQCLQVKQVVQEVQVWQDTFSFTLEFSNPDGTLFVLGTCCGASETEVLAKSQFEVSVMRVPQPGNIFLVQQLPMYKP